MDPLSITASVIAIVGALRAITTGYKSIISLGKASEEYLDLIGEIESVYAYLGMLHSVLNIGSSMQTFTTVDLTPLGAALSRMDYTIQKLQSALKQVEVDSKTNDSHKISKTKWQIYKSKVIQLKDEVHSRKQDLVDKVGLLQLALGYTLCAVVESCAVVLAAAPVGAIDPPAFSHGCLIQYGKPYQFSWQKPTGSLRYVTIKRVKRLLNKTWTSLFGPGASLHLRVARMVTGSRAIRTAECGTPRMLQYLFEKKMALPNDIAPCGTSLLLAAIRWDNNEVVDYLIELGADVFQPDFFGWSPILFVQYRKRHDPNYSHRNDRLQILADESYNTEFPEHPLIEILTNGTDGELQRVLNEYPSPINEPTQFGDTPLHMAIRLKRYSAIESLLVRGANPRKRNIFGRTPLHEAVNSSDYRAVQILLRFTSDNNIVDRSGLNPLEMALLWSSSRVMSLLLSSGMKIQLDKANAFVRLAKRSVPYCDDEAEIEAIANHLLDAGFNFDDCGGSPCDTAVQVDNSRVLHVLLKLGAKFHVPDGGELSVLHLAGYFATLNTIELLRKADIKELNPDAKYKGWTAMKIFEYRESGMDESFFPRQTRPTADESAAFRALIDEARERYINARLPLEASDLGVDYAGMDDDMPIGKEDGRVVGQQAKLPGAWVE